MKKNQNKIWNSSVVKLQQFYKTNLDWVHTFGAIKLQITHKGVLNMCTLMFSLFLYKIGKHRNKK